jgi:hypothetical protein
VGYGPKIFPAFIVEFVRIILPNSLAESLYGEKRRPQIVRHGI